MTRRIRRAFELVVRWPGPLLASMVLLPVVSFRLHRRGYRSTRTWLDARSAKPGARRARPDPELGDEVHADATTTDRERSLVVARELAYVVRLAARFVPDATCLRKALVLRHLLASREIEATIRFGVRRGIGDEGYGFHAWVEAEGVAVSEPPETVAGYSVLGDEPPA